MIKALVGPTALYLFIQRWLRQRQAWQWWHDQQIARLHKQAESIRDNLLQETFAFRRYLETTLTTQPDAEQAEKWLERFQLFYADLEKLSNQLSPPFIADSFPLALQLMIQNWQCTQPGLSVKLEVLSDWPEQSFNKNQIILSVITGLIELLIPMENCMQQLSISLEHHHKRYTLTLKYPGYPSMDGKSLINTPEIKHLKEIFHTLAAGRLEIVTDKFGFKGQLQWPADD
ncbi:hypothetical protein D0962_36045 [Leptolyngbyaceae cyanobacterium CCMR0082]|uniref:Signal transduction histidine kinase n=1 Tax=Adonisia turfae CCMR0082 TaxID=2304604 RepID=A0A6M0SJE8_9CYAN|nr:hypothetical protein [Adonisia turfae]NEZ68083.1 hypothetical protein [Adonisia turfae CCMR0082]